MTRTRWVSIAIAGIGLAVEAYAIYMMSAGRMESRTALTLIVVGMVVAFLPMFLLSRRHRRR
jgi:pilus assembly protein TadC